MRKETRVPISWTTNVTNTKDTKSVRFFDMSTPTSMDSDLNKGGDKGEVKKMLSPLRF